MATPRIPVHVRLRDARRQKGWTQVQLADAIGATQPAISMFEAGAAEALSQEKVNAIADALGVDRALVALGRAPRGRPRRSPRLWYCPNPGCLTNLPCEIDGALRYVPSVVRATAERLRCAYCGEPLLERCPHCNAPVAEGAFCTGIECGQPRVAASGDDEGIEDIRAWADAERARRVEVLVMTEPRDHTPSSRARGGRRGGEGRA